MSPTGWDARPRDVLVAPDQLQSATGHTGEWAMTLEVDVLRASFQRALVREPDLTRRFYERLFSSHPEARALFRRNSPEVQERMLADALVAAMDHLEDAPWLQENLGRLGARHAGYGVTPEMYGWVGDSLIATLRDAASADWTAEQEVAWGDLYAAVTQMMLAGHSAAWQTARPQSAT